MTSQSHTSPRSRIMRQRSVYDSVSQLIPAGHEKPLKQALYTTAAIALVAAVIFVGACTYFVLQLFIKPLLWAVLCGTFLFPFKYTLQKLIETWLTETLDNGIPLVLDTCILPFSMFAKLSDWLGALLTERWKILLCFCTGLLTLYFLHYFGLLTLTLYIASQLFENIWLCMYYTVTFVNDFNGVILLLLIVYFTTAFALNFEVFRIGLVVMWPLLIVYVIGVSGSLQIPFIIITLLLIILGIVNGDSSPEQTEEDQSNVTDTRQVNYGVKHKGNADIYFNILFALFGLVIVWLHMWILSLMLIPLTFWFCKRVLLHGKTSELVNVVCLRVFKKDKLTIVQHMHDFFANHKNAIFPSPLPQIFAVMKKGDRRVHLSILSSLPAVTSILIILILFTNAIFMTVFVSVKIQQESFLVVQVTSNVINETVSQHPEYKAWLPDNETMQKSMDSLVDTVYVQGREWISQKVQTTVGQNANVSKVEKQVLKIWDQIYQSLFTKKKNTARPLSRRNSFKSTERGLIDGFVDLLNMSEVLAWLQENVSALMSVGETLLSILRSNVTLIMSVLTAVFTTLLNGGTLVLNFVLSMIIFFTTLFYLLSSSTEQYKPIEVIGSAISPLTMGTPIESAIQDVVNGVFGASIKMFGFYGLYTWVNHCMFGSNLVYLPSVLAALFGVIPLLTTYWVCLPSALEIWLLQGSLARAVCLVICQFLPTLFVDAAIYNDISKSGGGAHPYVTGLAVAGGVYTFGLEGAIAGPLILCFLLVAVNLYTKATSADQKRTIK